MKINYQKGQMMVCSDYSAEFVKGAKRLNGQWNGEAWVFDERDKDRVNELLFNVYGQNELQTDDTVEVQVSLDALGKIEKALELFGRVLAVRFNRDQPVKLHPSVILLQGNFPKRGGSMNYPRLAPEQGTVLLVRDVPNSLYLKAKEQFAAGISLTETAQKKESMEALKEEKERLLQRLAEIEHLLNEVCH